MTTLRRPCAGAEEEIMQTDTETTTYDCKTGEPLAGVASDELVERCREEEVRTGTGAVLAWRDGAVWRPLADVLEDTYLLRGEEVRSVYVLD